MLSRFAIGALAAIVLMFVPLTAATITNGISKRLRSVLLS